MTLMNSYTVKNEGVLFTQWTCAYPDVLQGKVYGEEWHQFISHLNKMRSKGRKPTLCVGFAYVMFWVLYFSFIVAMDFISVQGDLDTFSKMSQAFIIVMIGGVLFGILCVAFTIYRISKRRDCIEHAVMESNRTLFNPRGVNIQWNRKAETVLRIEGVQAVMAPPQGAYYPQPGYFQGQYMPLPNNYQAPPYTV